MFRYSTISISFFIILFALIIQVQYEGSPWWVVLIPIIIYIAALAIGSIKIGLNFYFKSANGIKTKEKIIAITFDDGPHPEITPKLLDILKQENTPATFFCIGQKIEAHPNVVKVIHKDGHLIGNHSHTHHRWFDLFGKNKMIKEIELTNETIRKLIGKVPILFRPPYGVTNPTLKGALKKTNMISAGWSLRSFDTVWDKEKVLKKLMTKTKPGNVVLFHDTDEKILPLIKEYIAWINKNDFKIVGLDQLFNIEAYEAG